MQHDNQPNCDWSLPDGEIDLEALRRDLEYVDAESVDYAAYDLETGELAMAPTREEALSRLKDLAPNATRIFCDKIRMRVRRHGLLPSDDNNP